MFSTLCHHVLMIVGQINTYIHAKQMWIQFIPATQNKFIKLAQKFFLILVNVFGLEIGTHCNVHNGLIRVYWDFGYNQNTMLWIQFIPATQNKYIKLAQKFFLILVNVFGLEIGTHCNVHNGLIRVYWDCGYNQNTMLWLFSAAYET